MKDAPANAVKIHATLTVPEFEGVSCRYQISKLVPTLSSTIADGLSLPSFVAPTTNNGAASEDEIPL